MFKHILIGCCALVLMGAADDRFDSQRPGAYLGGQTFDLHAGSSFVWEVWETQAWQQGEVRVAATPHASKISVKRHKLMQSEEEKTKDYVLNQYVVHVADDMPAGTEFTVQTSGTDTVKGNPDWVFSFVIHVIQARREL